MYTKNATPPPHEKFEDYLRSHRLRRTDERMTILDAIMKIDGHFTAEDLRDHMCKEDYPVSVATVYSTLELLTDCGLVLKQRFADKGNCYERATGSNLSPHHHLICSICGKIKEVRDPAISRLLDSKRYAGFSPRSYSLTIYGVCTVCSRKSKNKRK